MINAVGQKLAIWEIWCVLAHMTTWMEAPSFGECFISLSETQWEESDWSFTEKNSGIVLQYDPGKDLTGIQWRIPEVRKYGRPND